MITDFIYYDLKVAALLCVFYLFYQLLLARETTHRLNRTVLLTAIVLSLVLPLCVVTLHETHMVENIPQAGIETAALNNVPTDTTEPTGRNKFLEWTLLVVLAVGMTVRLLYILHGYRKLRRMIVCGERHRLPSGTVVSVVESQVAPFSWMHTVVLSRSEWQSPSPSVLAHEEAHVRHRHSYDVIVVEVLTALQWFNPVVWFMRQELRTLHEYEADASVLSSGFSESQYIHLLMQKATGIQACTLANGISTHRTKKRIIMMLKPKSKRMAWFKALYIVPIVLLSLTMTAKTVIDYKTTDAEENPTAPVLQKYSAKMSDVEFVFYAKQQKAADLTQSELTKIMLNEGGGVSRAHILHLNGVYGSEKGNLFIVDDKEVSREEFERLQPENIASVTVLDVGPAKKVYGEKGRYGATIVKTRQTDQDTPRQKEDPVFDKCEQMPTFPDGEVKLWEYIAKNIKYPQQAIECGLQGRVIVEFIVEKDGSLSNAKTLENPKSSNMHMVVVNASMPDKQRQDAEAHNRAVQSLKDEAIRVVNAMPNWTPGKQQGKAVRVKFVIPITFRLN